MAWLISNFLLTFLLPPLNLLLVFALGIVLLNHHPTMARFLLGSAFMLLWLCATPYVAEATLHRLEQQTTPLSSPLPDADAIVILGGGSYFHAPEYTNQDVASMNTLLRLRYGARLYRETHKPILVTGGTPQGNKLSESEQMRDVLEQDFQVPVQWTEGTSNNTLENARNSFALLQKQGIQKIYLVSQASHIPRAGRLFRQAGFKVVEAPTGFTTRYKTDVLAFLPNTLALQNSMLFTREIISMTWYELKAWLTQLLV
jgi:uncharacterized SAM-binding protein YcdF (DUF218 family)